MSERLTNHFDYCDFTECRHYDKELAKSDSCNFIHSSREHCLEYAVYNKLREYEDLEEQGLLLKLPCKVGTEVYCISEIRCKHYLSKDCFNCSGDEFANSCYEPDQTIRKYAFVIEMLSEFGKTVFLTKEDAEEALRKKVE